MTITSAPSSSSIINREGDSSRPCLENRVAFQWENRGDVLGFRHGTIRDTTILDFIASAIDVSRPSQAVLDVGCGYGNHLFMLHSRLGKPQNVRMVGVNLDPNQLAFAEAFASSVDGYDNCHFEQADLSNRLPFDDRTFDVVALSDVLEHMTDPAAALRELMRVTRKGGLIVLSTPLKGSLFKRLAGLANAASGGRLYRGYYKGKGTTLDAAGKPVMEVHAGHDHVSEMSYKNLLSLVRSVGLEVRDHKLMQVMSGSRWFDRHPFVLSAMLLVEAVHGVLKRPSWAHSITLKLQVP